MEKVLVVFMSATTTARMKSILERKYQIPSRVLQTPSSIAVKGCSHCLEINEKDLRKVWTVVNGLNVTSKGVYRKGSLEKII